MFRILPDRPPPVVWLGHPISSVQEDPAPEADIHIGDHHSEPLGRVSTQAWVFNSSPGSDILPRLHDAKLNGMAQLGLNINGIEEIDGALYAQSWWCRAVGDYGN
ncbi:hypothetical protein D3C80_493060 [compost metagenome]